MQLLFAPSLTWEGGEKVGVGVGEGMQVDSNVTHKIVA